MGRVVPRRRVLGRLRASLVVLLAELLLLRLVQVVEHVLDIVFFVDAVCMRFFALAADAAAQIHVLAVVLLVGRHDLMAQHADDDTRSTCIALRLHLLVQL